MRDEIQSLAFTEGGLARASDLPRQTIAAARRRGDLKAIKSGRRWIILREDAEIWLRRCRDVGVIEAPIAEADRKRLADLNRGRSGAA